MHKILLALCALLTFQLGAMETSVPSLQQLTVKRLAENLENYTPEELEDIPDFVCKGLAYYWGQANPEAMATIAADVVNNAKPLEYCHYKPINDLAYSPDGTQIASAGQDGILKLWNSKTGELQHACNAHRDAIQTVAFRPATDTVTTTGQSLLQEWNRLTGELIKKTSYEDLHSAQYSADGETLALASSTMIHTLNSNMLEGERFKIASSILRGLAISPQGKLIALTSVHDAEIRHTNGTILHNITAQLEAEKFESKNTFGRVNFSPDGGIVGFEVTTDSFKRCHLQLVDPKTGKLLNKLLHPHLSCFTFSPDSTLVATGDREDNSSIKIWDVDGNPLCTFAFPCTIESMAWHPYNNSLAVGCHGGSVHQLKLPPILTANNNDTTYNAQQLAVASQQMNSDITDTEKATKLPRCPTIFSDYQPYLGIGGMYEGNILPY